MLIGKVKTDNNILLAPMAGITDYPFRKLCKEQGAGMVYTEMVSAKAVCYKDKKTISISKIYPEESPVALQIFGSEPDVMAKAAYALRNSGADIIDINMGCPTPKIVKNKDGSALMKDMKKARKVITSVVGAVDIPVTVKIRKGWDMKNVNAVEFSQMIEQAGAKAVAVHGRTRSEFYTGTADWEIIRKVKQKVKIPVIGNGDIKSGNDAINMLNQTGCDGVMIGRAALGNPWVFSQIKAKLNNEEYKPPDNSEKLNMIKRHYNLMLKVKGEHRAFTQMRKHIARYTKGMRNAAKARDKIYKLNDIKSIMAELHRLFEGKE